MTIQIHEQINFCCVGVLWVGYPDVTLYTCTVVSPLECFLGMFLKPSMCTSTIICAGLESICGHNTISFLPLAGVFVPDQIPTVNQTGFLLRRDDKYRWHRHWCKVDSKDMKFFIFNDANEELLIKQLPLERVTTIFNPPQTAECDKENCFILSGILDGNIEGESESSEEIYLAAYSEADYHQWRAVLSLLTGTNESVRISSASFLDSSQWGVQSTGNDIVSRSNRESMISTASFLPSGMYLPGHDSGISSGDVSTLLKQHQPLPSPPPVVSCWDRNLGVYSFHD